MRKDSGRGGRKKTNAVLPDGFVMSNQCDWRDKVELVPEQESLPKKLQRASIDQSRGKGRGDSLLLQRSAGSANEFLPRERTAFKQRENNGRVGTMRVPKFQRLLHFRRKELLLVIGPRGTDKNHDV